MVVVKVVELLFYNGCCKGGRIVVRRRKAWPYPLDRLIGFGESAESTEFMRLIRSYNSMFAFCSLGVKVGDSINTGHGPYVFGVNGLPSHRIGSLVPAPNKDPKFIQLYIYHTINEVSNRMSAFSSVEGGRGQGPDRQIVAALIDMLNTCNELVKQFRMIQVSPARACY